MTSQEEKTNPDREKTDLANFWGGIWPIPSPHSTQSIDKPLVPISIPFLVLPREIRDIMYRHLLSTKYTKYTVTIPEVVGAVPFLRGSRLTWQSGLNQS